jgi:hypothetical protein
VTIDPDELVEMKGSKGSAHLIIKCKGCERTNNVTMLERKDQTLPLYTAADSGSPVTFLEIECRGVEISQWILASDDDAAWTASGEESGTKFEDIDLSDEFYDVR